MSNFGNFNTGQMYPDTGMNINNGAYGNMNGNFNRMGTGGYGSFPPSNANMQTPPPNPPVILGKHVKSENDILVQDVPMDGSIGVFPLADYSAVIVKAWNNKGTIDTVRYVPEASPAKEQEPIGVDLTPVMERLDKLEGMLRKNNRPYKSYKPQNKDKDS